MSIQSRLRWNTNVARLGVWGYDTTGIPVYDLSSFEPPPPVFNSCVGCNKLIKAVIEKDDEECLNCFKQRVQEEKEQQIKDEWLQSMLSERKNNKQRRGKKKKR
jgi:hypothetical protein